MSAAHFRSRCTYRVHTYLYVRATTGQSQFEASLLRLEHNKEMEKQKIFQAVDHCQQRQRYISKRALGADVRWWRAVVVGGVERPHGHGMVHGLRQLLGADDVGWCAC